MAWTASPALRAAIDAPARQPISSLLIWVNGDDQPGIDFTYMMDGWSVDRTPSDTPENISRFAGSIAAQATITLTAWSEEIPGGDGQWKSRDLAPYVGRHTGFLARDFGIGLKVRLRTGFQTTAGAEELPMFYGRIDHVHVADDGAITLTCLDYAQDLQSDVELPPVGVANDSPGIRTQSIVEHLLRSGGFYRTAPPLGNCVLSVPAILPEVGEVAGPLQAEPSQPGRNTLNPAPSYDNRYVMTETYGPRDGVRLIVDGWWKAASTGINRTLVTIGADVQPAFGGNDGFRFGILSSGALYAGNIGGDTRFDTPAGIFPNDNAWHYIHFDIRHHTAGSTWTVYVDDQQYVVSMHNMKPPDNLSPIVILGGLVHEGVAIRLPGPDYQRTESYRYTWTPNYTTDVRGGSQTVRSIPRGMTGSAWSLINDIATATGAVCRWREDGVWRWQERDSWVQRRIQPTSGSYSGDRALLASGYSYSGASRLKSVTIDYLSLQVQRSTVAAPAWTASDVIIVPKNSTITLSFDSDTPIVGILPIIRTSTPTASSSYMQTVPANQVGDPAARVVAGLRVRPIPTANGFRMVVVNPLAFDVAMWDPTTGQPALTLQGWTVIGNDPVEYTMLASPRSRESLTLPPSAWRQDAIAARRMCDAIAAEAALPAVVFEQQEVVGDPRITVDDVVQLRAEDVMDELITAQIIGITATDTDMSWLVRACWAPIGLVLDVPGRMTLPGTLAV